MISIWLIQSGEVPTTTQVGLSQVQQWKRFTKRAFEALPKRSSLTVRAATLPSDADMLDESSLAYDNTTRDVV